MPDALAPVWYGKFMDILQHHESSTLLKDAAIRGQLGKWTTALTEVVCSTCEAMNWKAAAKGNRSTLLPEAREEYLALDVVAFESAGDRRWRFPVAAIELENSRADDRVAIRSGRFSAPVRSFGLFSAIGRMRRKATPSFATCPSRSYKR
jgi:hypothetical protein